MSRLFLAELRRIAARRLVRLTVVLTVVAIAIGGAAAFLSTSALSQSAYEQRVADADTRRDQSRQQVDDCLRAHGVNADGERVAIPDDVARACLPKSIISADDPRLHRQRLEDLLRGVSGGLAILSWTVGASLVGAEFASRGITTSITWEPRRGRVFVAKAAATILAGATLAIVALLAFVAAMLPALAFHGAPLRAIDPSVASLAGTIVRGTALSAVAAGLGFSIAAIGRNTAAALGAGFAYIVIFENIVGSYKPGARRWLLLGNVIVFVVGRNDGADVPGRTVAEAGLILAAVVLTFLVAALGIFRRRDIA